MFRFALKFRLLQVTVLQLLRPPSTKDKEENYIEDRIENCAECEEIHHIAFARPAASKIDFQLPDIRCVSCRPRYTSTDHRTGPSGRYPSDSRLHGQNRNRSARQERSRSSGSRCCHDYRNCEEQESHHPADTAEAYCKPPEASAFRSFLQNQKGKLQEEIEEQRDREEGNHSVRGQASGRQVTKEANATSPILPAASQDQSRQYTTEE